MEKQKLKVGDKLVCINNAYTDFTIGKEYEIFYIDLDYISVVNDYGVSINFLSINNTFKLKEEPITLNEFISDNWAEKLKINDTAYKETEGKLFYELDFEFITQIAERMASNKGKYEPYNWKKPMEEKDFKELLQAVFRHSLEIVEGKFEDDGREFGHLEATACDVMMICYQLKKYKK